MTWTFLDYVVFLVGTPLAAYVGMVGGLRYMRDAWEMDVPYDQRRRGQRVQ